MDSDNHMSKRGTERSGRPWFISNPLLVLLLMFVISALWLARNETTGYLNLGYGEFKQVLQAPGVQFRDVHVGKNEIRGRILTRDPVSGAEIKEGKSETDPQTPNELVRLTPFRTARQGIESDSELQKMLDKYVGANYTADDEDSVFKSIFSILVMGAIMIGVLFLTFYLIRWLSGGQTPFSFGRSRHKLYADKDNRTTFQDVAGIDEAVAELREVVDFLKRPQKYMALGGRIPKGVLLIGPPGTGKTLLAKAVAGEADVPFFSLSGSDFVEMFVGVGASRVRDLFREAEAKAPCIVFIDELDALGRSRAGNTINPHEEREQTLNALLVEMDGFDTNRGVIIMAATNRPEMLDQALLRPGRFDRHVVVDQPDINGREAILKVHSRNIKMATDVDLRKIAALTPGSVGADLANIINEAALLAARKGKAEVGMADFNEAVERGAVGLERKSRVMKSDEKRRVAIHEGGHALVACACPNADPVHKVSIIPRGVGALGYTLSRPEDDRHIQTRGQLETLIKTLLGGTMAEELTFGDFATGAASDLEKANQIARRMVKMFGMSRLGRIFVREGDENSFLPSVFGDGVRDCSEDTAREIDLEVRQIIDSATQQVRDILKRNRPALEALAARLVDKEVIEGSELKELLENAGMVPEAPIVPVEANGTTIAHGNIPHAPAS